MLAQLIPLDGGEPIELTNEITLVGRKPSVCDLVLQRGSVSKMHCVLVKTDGLLFIRDLGSTNGTKVNGQKVTRGALLPGDELAFASAKFRVHLGPAPAERLEDHVPTEMLTAGDNLPLPLDADLPPAPAPQAKPDRRDAPRDEIVPAEVAPSVPQSDPLVPAAEEGEGSDSDVQLLPGGSGR